MSHSTKTINTVRALSIDAIQKANSGHPGLPMGAAPMAFELWANHLNATAKDPKWINRDRFVLSAGHGSALYYALLHMFGYKVKIEDLKNFRQWGAVTPGHPEYGMTDGIDATTGPLGQGIAMAVGMAMAEKRLAAKFNKEDNQIIDHYTFALSGDGCLQEGVSAEAASLAGHLGLGKLILLYDNNGITIDGSTDLTFTEDVNMRFKAYGWQVLNVADGNDLAAINAALETAKKETTKPTLINIKTIIGYGSPNKAGTSGCHGAPLGDDEIKLTKKAYGLDPEKSFFVEEDVKADMASIIAKRDAAYDAWQTDFESYKADYPEDYKMFEQWLSGDVDDTELMLDKYFACLADDNATRSAGGAFMNAIKPVVPNLMGGSADLNGSTKTYLKGYGDFNTNKTDGDNFFFGIREHAMGAICNGMSLHGGIRPYCATFMVFSDYMKPSIRLSALMKQPVIYVFTHDSIGVGEDGPTHQPIEHLLMLRSIPNVKVFRPSGPKETGYAWISALKNTDGPSVIILSRQKLANLKGVCRDALKGGYIVAKESSATPDGILIGTGSEVEILVKAKEELLKDGMDVRVVSIPCKRQFLEQDATYIESVIPKQMKKRIIMEAGVSMGWHDIAGDGGKIIGIDRFGESAPGSKVFTEFGFTVDNVIKTYKAL